MPLTVVSQIWLKEALIKDIFDPWDKENVKVVYEEQNISASVYPSIPAQPPSENQ